MKAPAASELPSFPSLAAVRPTMASSKIPPWPLATEKKGQAPGSAPLPFACDANRRLAPGQQKNRRLGDQAVLGTIPGNGP